MIGKNAVPYALSGAAALVVACLGMSKLYAAEQEAPAVLNFATSYQQLQQQRLQPPPPRLPEPPSVAWEPEKKVKPKQNDVSVALPVDRSQLAALRRDIEEKTQLIAKKNAAINALEQQIIALEKAASVPDAANEAPHLIPADKEAMLDLVKDLRQVFSLHPTHNSLVTKLAQAKNQLKEVQLAEAALRSQLKTLNDGKDRILSAHEEALKQKVEQHNAKIAELETNLSSSRQDIEKITAERDNITAKEQKLAAENAADKQAFDKEKQQLLEQIAQNGPVESQLAASVKVQQELQLQLSEAQQMKTALQGDKDKLQAQLVESQIIAKSLQTQMDMVKLQQPVAATSVNAVQGALPKESLQDNDKKFPELQSKLDAALAELATVKKQKVEVKTVSNLPNITPEQLKKKSAREGYAIGMSLGDEILQIQAENNNWGTATEKNLVLAGIVDAFLGQAKLPTDVLQNTLSEVSDREKKDQEKLVTHLDETTKKYLKTFTKKKNTKKSPSGFWYNINYEGDAPIPKNAMIDVVVRESLTNGDVVTDMDASGTMLTQPLSDFPSVFREALEKLRNHGSITIVVPPELAYKEKGFPPKIPPNATIIYELRISAVYP